jgi:glutamate-1-semialdehyde 2,1-aminomutase
MREIAACGGVPLQVTGFGAAFALHFTDGEPPRDYRSTLRDDRPRLSQWIRRALEEGIYLLPDGRVYVSAVHSADDIARTGQAAARILSELE